MNPVSGGERSVAIGGDASGTVLVTGDNNQVLVGNYLRLSDAYIDPTSVYERVVLDRFVGRAWLDAQVDALLAEQDRGVLILEAGAGLGKTAYMAHLATTRNCIHHFVETARGGAGVARGLQSIVAQIILKFELEPYANDGVLPVTAGSAEFLSSLLARVAAIRDQRQLMDPILIVVDALDESASIEGYNAMGLPRVLPRGVYLICSQRPVDIAWSVAPVPPRVIRLEAAEADNLTDMREYLTRAAQRPAVVALLAKSQRTPTEFVDILLDRCRGVWIYLQYVVTAIELGTTSLDLDALPYGVWQYYADFWVRWRSAASWRALTLPLLGALAAVQEDASAEALCRLAGLSDVAAVEELLERAWRPFLTVVSTAGASQYRLYHASFREFLDGRVDADDLTTAQQLVARELASATTAAHAAIAAGYIDAWGGLEANLRGLQDESGRKRDGGYGLRHLIEHLLAGGRLLDARHVLSAEWTRDEHRLVSRPGWRGWVDQLFRRRRFVIEAVSQNVWFLAKGGTADLAGYVADQQRTWNAAEAESQRLLTSGELAASVALEVRCALAIASLNDVAGNVGPRLLEELVKQQIVAPTMAYAYALRAPDADQRMLALFRVAPYLPEERSRREAYRAAIAAMLQQHDSYQLRAVTADLPQTIPDWVAREVLRSLGSRPADSRWWTADVLSALVNSASDTIVAEILSAAGSEVDSRLRASAALRSVDARAALLQQLKEEARAGRFRLPDDALAVLLDGVSQLEPELAAIVMKVARASATREYGARILAGPLLRAEHAADRPRLAEAILTQALKRDVREAIQIFGPVLSLLPDSARARLEREVRAAADPHLEREYKVFLAGAFAASGDSDGALAVVDELGPPTGPGSYYPTSHGEAIAAVASHVPQAYVSKLVQRIRTVSDRRARRIALERLAPRLGASELKAAFDATTQINDRYYSELVQVEGGRALAPMLRDHSMLDWVFRSTWFTDERLLAVLPNLPPDILPAATKRVRALRGDPARAAGFVALAAAGAPNSDTLIRDAVALLKRLPREQRAERMAKLLVDDTLATALHGQQRQDLYRIVMADLLDLVQKERGYSTIHFLESYPALLTDDTVREWCALGSRISDRWAAHQIFALLATRLPETSLRVLAAYDPWFGRSSDKQPEASSRASLSRWLSRETLDIGDVAVVERLATEANGRGRPEEEAALLMLADTVARDNHGRGERGLRAIARVDNPASRLELLLTAVECLPGWRADVGCSAVLCALSNGDARAKTAALERLAKCADPVAESVLRRAAAFDRHAGDDAAEATTTSQALDDIERMLAKVLSVEFVAPASPSITVSERLTLAVKAATSGGRGDLAMIAYMAWVLPRPDAETAIEQYIQGVLTRADVVARALPLLLPSPPQRIINLLVPKLLEGTSTHIDPRAFAAIAEQLTIDALIPAWRAAGVHTTERARLFSGVVRRLTAGPRDEAHRRWCDLLHYATSGHREDVHTLLREAMPLIRHVGGPHAIEGVLDAVDRAQAWWP